jgi:hypothetical protein
MNEQAIWKLVGEGGIAALTIDRLTEETGESPLKLSQLYPEPEFMVLVLVETIHNQSMTTLPPSTSSTQDRLTDMVMHHLDLSLVHRESIRRLWSDLVTMPSALLTLRPYLMKMVARILKESGIESNDLWAPIRLRAYFGLFLYVLYTWLYDETPQQEHTLVTLDKGLKQLEALPW